MNNEIIKISGKPPDPDSPTSVCPGSYQSGDRYEGPVCVVEGAGQGGGAVWQAPAPLPSKGHQRQGDVLHHHGEEV